MTLRFTQINTTSLDAIETSIGPSAVLEFFSADPAVDPTQPDQGILLARIYLPDDWLADESGGTKAKQGTWEGEGVDEGVIRSFRLKRSDGVCVCEGSVSETGGGGDLVLSRSSIGVDQKIRITAFTLSFENPGTVLDPRLAIVAVSQANTITSSVFVSQTVVVTDDTWTHRSAASEAMPLYSEGMGPATHQGWYKGCLIETTGDLHFAQGTQCSFTNNNCTMYGTFVWRNATATWHRLDDRTDTRWYKHFSSGFGENYDTAYDSTRHCVWYSEGGPGWGNPDGVDPRRGQLRFDIATSEYFNHRPSSQYQPSTQDEIDHYFYEERDGNTRLIGFDDIVEVIDGKLYNFCRWNESQALVSVIDPATEVRPGYVITRTSYPATNVAPKPTFFDADGVPRDRGGQHRKERYLWVLASQSELYILNLNEEPGVWKWRHVPTSGPKPITRPELTGFSRGVIAELHEDANCIVAYCGRAHTSSEVGTLLRQTWVLDLATRRWRNSLSAANGDVVPTGTGGAVIKSMFYSPNERVVRLLDGGATKFTIWDFQPERTGKGEITSFELINDPSALTTPYGQGQTTKHTNMAYCPLNDRIYVSGGDVTGTAAPDWTWSMDVATGVWRRDAIRVDGTTPHPVAAQDGMGFMWDDASNRGGTGRGKFLFWPGAYIQGGTTPTHTWARGWWTFDPVTNVWEQFTGLWGTLGTGPGNLHGGAWNPDDDTVYIVGNSSGGKVTTRYHLGTQTQLATLTWTNGATFMNGTNAAGGQFTSRGMQVLHNGYIYTLGTATTDGIYRFSVFVRYHIATNTIQRLASPPVRPGYISAVEARIALSGDRIVWPAANGPDGEFGGTDGDPYYGMCVYDIETDTWVRDEQIPAYGTFAANCVMRTALPDGRVCMAGSVFGRPQTHFWMYNPAS